MALASNASVRAHPLNKKKSRRRPALSEYSKVLYLSTGTPLQHGSLARPRAAAHRLNVAERDALRRAAEDEDVRVLLAVAVRRDELLDLRDVRRSHG
jgi:hypothetical protein